MCLCVCLSVCLSACLGLLIYIAFILPFNGLVCRSLTAATEWHQNITESTLVLHLAQNEIKRNTCRLNRPGFLSVWFQVSFLLWICVLISVCLSVCMCVSLSVRPSVGVSVCYSRWVQSGTEMNITKSTLVLHLSKKETTLNTCRLIPPRFRSVWLLVSACLWVCVLGTTTWFALT